MYAGQEKWKSFSLPKGLLAIAWFTAVGEEQEQGSSAEETEAFLFSSSLKGEILLGWDMFFAFVRSRPALRCTLPRYKAEIESSAGTRQDQQATSLDRASEHVSRRKKNSLSQQALKRRANARHKPPSSRSSGPWSRRQTTPPFRPLVANPPAAGGRHTPSRKKKKKGRPTSWRLGTPAAAMLPASPSSSALLRAPGISTGSDGDDDALEMRLSIDREKKRRPLPSFRSAWRKIKRQDKAPG